MDEEPEMRGRDEQIKKVGLEELVLKQMIHCTPFQISVKTNSSDPLTRIVDHSSLLSYDDL